MATPLFNSDEKVPYSSSATSSLFSPSSTSDTNGLRQRPVNQNSTLSSLSQNEAQQPAEHSVVGWPSRVLNFFTTTVSYIFSIPGSIYNRLFPGPAPRSDVQAKPQDPQVVREESKERVENADTIAADRAQRLEKYFQLLDQYPEILGPTGDASKGEIEIVRDLNKIAEIETTKKVKIGILGETSYQKWICFAVKFPDGQFGFYTTLVWEAALKNSKEHKSRGAVVLPFLPDGRILLNVMYRFPVHEVVIEALRGNPEPGEQISKVASREAGEEQGAILSKVEELGKINADTGITTGGIGMVKAFVSGFKNPNRDSAEVSITNCAFTREQLETAIRDDLPLSVKFNGQEKQLKIEDGFTLAVLYKNHLKTCMCQPIKV